MKHTLARRIALGALTAGAATGLVVMVPGAAFGATPADTTAGTKRRWHHDHHAGLEPILHTGAFQQAQQAVEAALAGRVTQLDALSTAANNSANHLTTGDRQTLVNDITTVELPGIQTLQTQVAAGRHVQGPAAPWPTRWSYDYRVYVVMTPQTHLTIVTDDETYIEGVFTNLEPTIATAIQNALNSGKDVTAAQAAFTDLKSQVSAAQSETSGQSAQLLAQMPTGYPGNWQVFQAARTNATNAHTTCTPPTPTPRRSGPICSRGRLVAARPERAPSPRAAARLPRRPRHRAVGRGAGRLRSP